MTGTLTTNTGTLADAMVAGNPFTVSTINSLVVNGVSFTDGTAWGAGGPAITTFTHPASSSSSDIITTQSPGVATVSADGMTFTSSPQFVSFGPVGGAVKSGVFGTVPTNLWTEAVGTITVVPEPSAFLCTGLIVVGLACGKLVALRRRLTRGTFQA